MTSVVWYNFYKKGIVELNEWLCIKHETWLWFLLEAVQGCRSQAPWHGNWACLRMWTVGNTLFSLPRKITPDCPASKSKHPEAEKQNLERDQQTQSTKKSWLSKGLKKNIPQSFSLQSPTVVVTKRLFLGHSRILWFPVIPSQAKQNTHSFAQAPLTNRGTGKLVTHTCDRQSCSSKVSQPMERGFTQRAQSELNTFQEKITARLNSIPERTAAIIVTYWWHTAMEENVPIQIERQFDTTINSAQK